MKNMRRKSITTVMNIIIIIMNMSTNMNMNMNMNTNMNTNITAIIMTTNIATATSMVKRRNTESRQWSTTAVRALT